MVNDSGINEKAQLRLLQFMSPAMPVGAYSYSQGLEWAVEQRWINDAESFKRWVIELISSALALQELPLLRRLHRSFLNRDITAVERWSQTALAVRDTAEFRREEQDKAVAYLRVLESITCVDDYWPSDIFLRSQLVSMCYFSVDQAINEEQLTRAYAHNWLENTLIAGVKIIPLGQSDAQKMLFLLADHLLDAINTSLTIEDDDVGVSLPALSMASCGHECQYSRIYRS